MDIQVGDRVTYKYLKQSDAKEFTSIIETNRNLEDYKRMIESKEEISSIEILKIERPKYEVIEEKKELLTKEEKEFLIQFIKFANYIPFKIRINKQFLEFFVDDTRVRSSYEFYDCFKGLEENTFYTLKELGLK